MIRQLKNQACLPNIFIGITLIYLQSYSGAFVCHRDNHHKNTFYLIIQQTTTYSKDEEKLYKHGPKWKDAGHKCPKTHREYE